MADFFKEILKDFWSDFTGVKKMADLTVHDTGMNKAMSELEKRFSKKNNKLYKQEVAIVSSLRKVLNTSVPKERTELIQRTQKIKRCLDDLAEYPLISGSVFVGMGTAKYWRMMSRFCQAFVDRYQHQQFEKFSPLAKKFIDGVHEVQDKLMDKCEGLKDDFENKEVEIKKRHNEDATSILGLWNSAIGKKGENITAAYRVQPKDFDRVYTLICLLTKSDSSLVKLVKNNGSNVSDNVYWNLFSAIKDVQRNWNKYKK